MDCWILYSDGSIEGPFEGWIAAKEAASGDYTIVTTKEV